VEVSVPGFVCGRTDGTLKPSELATQQSYKDGGKESKVVGGLIMLSGGKSRGRVYSYVLMRELEQMNLQAGRVMQLDVYLRHTQRWMQVVGHR
jgi:fructose-bisphosphate aldolase class 1